MPNDNTPISDDQNDTTAKSTKFNWDHYYGTFIGPFFTGAWLLLLYFICSTTVLYSLSAHQLNDAIKDYASKDAKHPGMAQIKDRYRQWLPLQQQFEASSTYVLEQATRLRSTREEVSRLESTRSDAHGSYLNAVSDIADFAAAKGLDVNLAREAYNTLGENTPSKDKKAELKKIRNETEEGAKPSDPVLKAIVHSQDIARKLTIQSAKIEAHIAEIGRIEKRISTEKENARILNCEILNVQAGLNTKRKCDDPGEFSNLTRDQDIGDFLNALRFFAPEKADSKHLTTDPFFKRIIAWARSFNLAFLIAMPAEMLTMFMVISMGALGGTIHLTRIFLSKEYQNGDGLNTGLWYFLFRPLLGCIVAITVFILVHAGVLVVATPSTQSGESSLSPYFVSFLGIISGLIAQDAVNTIQSTGARWFSNADTSAASRWAYSLKTLLNEGPDPVLKRKNLEGILNISSETLRKWEAEDDPVPHKYQTTIAAFFQRPVRDLFSDLERSSMRVDAEP